MDVVNELMCRRQYLRIRISMKTNYAHIIERLTRTPFFPNHCHRFRWVAILISTNRFAAYPLYTVPHIVSRTTVRVLLLLLITKE